MKAFLEKLRSLSALHKQNIDDFEKEFSEFEQQSNRAVEKVATTNEITDNAFASELWVHIALIFVAPFKKVLTFNFFSLTELQSLHATCFEHGSRLETIMKPSAELEEALVGTDARERVVLENKQLFDEFKRRYPLFTCRFCQITLIPYFNF